MPDSPPNKSQKRGPAAGRQAVRHARLQDRRSPQTRRVALVEARTVERVRHRADQLRADVARQLRVGVERDDVPHARAGRIVSPDDQREASRRRRRAAAR